MLRQGQADYQFAEATRQAQFQFGVEQARLDYQFAEATRAQEYQYQEANRQMEYRFQEELRNSELQYQNQLMARDYEYQSQFLQYDYARAEQVRQNEYKFAVETQQYEMQMAEQRRQQAFQEFQVQQQFEQQQGQVQMNRAYEEARRVQQEDVIAQNAALAGFAYENELRQIDLMYMQEEEAASQKKMAASRDVAQARAEIRASGRVGNTVDNLIADYNRQQAMFDYATNRNLAFTGMSLQERKRGSQAQYAARMASEQPYLKQPIQDAMRGASFVAGSGVAPIKGVVGGGVAPLMGADPIRGSVTRGQATRGQVTRGTAFMPTITRAPVYQGFQPPGANTTAYWLQGAGAVVSGIGSVVNAVDGYKDWKKGQPGRKK